MRKNFFFALSAVVAALFLPCAAHAQCENFNCESWGVYNPNTNTISGYSLYSDYEDQGWYLEVDSYVNDPNGNYYWVGSDDEYDEAEVDFSYVPSMDGVYGIFGYSYYNVEGWWGYDGASYYNVGVEYPVITSCTAPSWVIGNNSFTCSGSGFSDTSPSLFYSGNDGNNFIQSDSVTVNSDSQITVNVILTGVIYSVGWVTVDAGSSYSAPMEVPEMEPPPAPTLLVTSGGTQVASNSTVWISATPSLSLVAALVPAPGTALSGTVSFGFTAVTNGYGDWNYGCFNSTTINASSSWDIGATFATTGVCGGAATVTATYGSYPQQSLTFSILGNSGVPDKGTVNGFIGSSPWFLHQIVQAESAYQQFVANGWPKFGGPNGFGLMQVDPPSGAFQIWDWTQNATAGLAILAGFNATAYWTRQVRNWQLFNSSNPAYTAAPPANTVEGPCTFSYNPTGGAYPFSDAVWIKRYNAGTNQEYIQFTPGTNSNGNPQGVWDVEPLNGNNLDYVQAVCSATP